MLLQYEMMQQWKKILVRKKKMRVVFSHEAQNNTILMTFTINVTKSEQIEKKTNKQEFQTVLHHCSLLRWKRFRSFS